MPILIIDGIRYPFPATQKPIRVLADDGTTELFSVDAVGAMATAAALAITGALSGITALAASTSVATPALDGVAPTGAGLKIGAAGTSKLGFYGHTVTVQQTGVAVDAAGIHAALVALGLITA